MIDFLPVPGRMPYLCYVTAIDIKEWGIHVELTVEEPEGYKGVVLYKDYPLVSGNYEYLQQFLNAFKCTLEDWPKCKEAILDRQCVSISARPEDKEFLRRFGTHQKTFPRTLWSTPYGKARWDTFPFTIR